MLAAAETLSVTTADQAPSASVTSSSSSSSTTNSQSLLMLSLPSSTLSSIRTIASSSSADELGTDARSTTSSSLASSTRASSSSGEDLSSSSKASIAIGVIGAVTLGALGLWFYLRNSSMKARKQPAHTPEISELPEDNKYVSEVDTTVEKNPVFELDSAAVFSIGGQ